MISFLRQIMAKAAETTSPVHVAERQPFSPSRSENANKESITLLWFDPNIGSGQDTEQTKQKLRSINDYVVLHTDCDQCVADIQAIKTEKIFLITSGSKAFQLLPHVAHLRQVDSIFIFCFEKDHYQRLTTQFPKIIGIYARLGHLCSSIRHEINLVDKQLQTFNVFDRHQRSIKDLSQQSGEFLWLQLFHYIIIRLPRQQQAKQQMIDVCRQYYRGNSKELEMIDEFERDYHPEDAIRWYSKQSFLYKMVNKALRSEDLDQLQTFRFFIGDLSQSLAREHQKILSSGETSLTLYRGGALDDEEFKKLRGSEGQIISTDSYLSTSRSKSLALMFVRSPTQRREVAGVLFEIQCDIQQLGTSVIFADIASLSNLPEEEEILFDLNASFRLDSVEQDGPLFVVHMTATNDGEQITKDYIALTQEKAEEQSVAIVFGRLMCDMGRYEKSQKYFMELLQNLEGEDLAWIEFNVGRALTYTEAWDEARGYYERAYARMMDVSPAREKDSAGVLNNIGLLLSHRGEYYEALDYLQKTLRIHEKFYPSGHVCVATIFNNIGLALYNQGKYAEALGYYERALEMHKKFYPSGHTDIATSLNNIGAILRIQGKYVEALDYNQRALKIHKNFYPTGHVDVAKSLTGIALSLDNQRKYTEALEYYNAALAMCEKFHPSGHAHIATSLSNIGLSFGNQGKYAEALDYLQRALKTCEAFYASGHAHIATNLNDIGVVLCSQGKYAESLDYFDTARIMHAKFYPTGHVCIAKTLTNSGLALNNLQYYTSALNDSNRALKMYEKLNGSDNVNIATSLSNVGLALFNHGKHRKALGYMERALKLLDEFYPNGHVDVARILERIAMSYATKSSKRKALKYYDQALSIYRKLLSADHPDLMRVEYLIILIAQKK
jgi:tetratricopeptide (TPR) repeat protein